MEAVGHLETDLSHVVKTVGTSLNSSWKWPMFEEVPDKHPIKENIMGVL